MLGCFQVGQRSSHRTCQNFLYLNIKYNISSSICRFYNNIGPGASSLPGFLTAERVEELKRLPNFKLMPEPLRKVFPNQMERVGQFRPDLSGLRTLSEAGIFFIVFENLSLVNAISRHINQEPPNIIRMLRIATRPMLAGRFADEMAFDQLARNIFEEARAEMQAEGLDEIEEADIMLANATDVEDTGALSDHINCSSVLKKRRRKMRRHKHKKRLRKNRYKTR